MDIRVLRFWQRCAGAFPSDSGVLEHSLPLECDAAASCPTRRQCACVNTHLINSRRIAGIEMGFAEQLSLGDTKKKRPLITPATYFGQAGPFSKRRNSLNIDCLRVRTV